jgi:hypothetical protein
LDWLTILFKGALLNQATYPQIQNPALGPLKGGDLVSSFLVMTRICEFGKTFETLNQSWIKPLDDFDTTWLVALASGNGPDLLAKKHLTIVIQHGWSRLIVRLTLVVLCDKFFRNIHRGRSVLHPNGGSLPKKISPSG